MDRDQFDRLSLDVAAAGTRRQALRLLVAGAIASAAGRASLAEARKQRNRRRSKQDRVHGEQAEFCTNLCIDCSAKRVGPGANLDRCDFDDESFVDGFDLSSAHLSKTCFARAELRNARFNSATVSRACFADADLTGASFRGANVSNAVFCGADLSGADFRGTRITAAQLACATVGCDTILPNGKPALPCAPGERCCAGGCVDTDEDPANCGACGRACRAGDACVGGACKGAGTCQAGQNMCISAISCNGTDITCQCVVSVSGQMVCGNIFAFGSPCANCTVDEDCTPITGPGSTCTNFNGEFCGCQETGRRACVAPCNE